jgi:predicted Rossmann-fold nucleotide-binding protein
VEAVIDLADAVDSDDAVDASVGPRGSLENLSQSEIESLLSTGRGGIHALFRKCALAVLNSGSDSDNAKEIFDRFADFDVDIVRHPWGIRLQIRHAPANAFVDGQMIRGIKEHLFAVLRDVVYITNEVVQGGRFDLDDPAGITNAVFHVLRNARVLDVKTRPNLVVCWGGHAISSLEYDYTKKVGYELGLRGLDVCTGCGPGAMKGPMKGATIGHAKQRIGHGRYIGITEPGIIAAEPPNAIVNQLVIMPDIEKRLEAFARLGHGIVVFPGGVGTTEEILYLLGILLDPANAALHRRYRGAGGAGAPAHHRRRPGRRRAPHGAGDVAGARLPQGAQRFLRLQLAAADPAGLPASLPSHARDDALARAAPRPAGARAGGQSPARLLGNRGGQRQGIRRLGHRGAGTL